MEKCKIGGLESYARAIDLNFISLKKTASKQHTNKYRMNQLVEKSI